MTVEVLRPRDTWLVLQRDVSASVQVRGRETVIAALVLDLANGSALAAHVGESSEQALHEALATAAKQPADGRRPTPPERVLCGVGLAERAQGQLHALGFDVRADEVEPGDAAED